MSPESRQTSLSFWGLLAVVVCDVERLRRLDPVRDMNARTLGKPSLLENREGFLQDKGCSRLQLFSGLC